jgi:hypothetical protein
VAGQDDLGQEVEGAREAMRRRPHHLFERKRPELTLACQSCQTMKAQSALSEIRGSGPTASPRSRRRCHSI